MSELEESIRCWICGHRAVIQKETEQCWFAYCPHCNIRVNLGDGRIYGYRDDTGKYMPTELCKFWKLQERLVREGYTPQSPEFVQRVKDELKDHLWQEVNTEIGK